MASYEEKYTNVRQIFLKSHFSTAVWWGDAKTPESVTHRWKGAQHLHPVLSSERMRRVHAAEVGQAGGRVRWSPTQDVAQLGRVSVDSVPRHQELGGKTGREKVTRRRKKTHFRHSAAELYWTEGPHLDGLRYITDSAGVQPHQPGHFSNNGIILKPGNKEFKINTVSTSNIKCCSRYSYKSHVLKHGQ